MIQFALWYQKLASYLNFAYYFVVVIQLIVLVPRVILQFHSQKKFLFLVIYQAQKLIFVTKSLILNKDYYCQILSRHMYQPNLVSRTHHSRLPYLEYSTFNLLNLVLRMGAHIVL